MKSGVHALLTHCCQELMHTVWDTLLNNEFLHAYEHRIMLQCADGIFHQLYPQIFTYSADYPKK